MTDAVFLSFVKAGAALQGLRLDDQHLAAVAGHLAVLAGMAAQLDGAGLDPDDELAQIYCPAPFAHSRAGDPAP